MLEHLPERDRAAVSAGCARGRGPATTTSSRSTACAQLADELDRSHPGAAASLREGLEETLTLTRLGIRGQLKLTLMRRRTRSSR